MLAYVGDTKTADEARVKAEAQRRPFVRAGKEDGSVGRGSAPAWLARRRPSMAASRNPGQSSAEQPHLNSAKTLVTSLNELVRKPSPIGAMVQSKGDPTMTSAVGTLTNGGVWPSINGTLIWALAS